jgi:hypothetical protein
MTDLAFMTMAEASRLIRARKLSPIELTAALLARIAALDGVYHAYIAVTAEIALAQAKAAEAEIMAGTWRGPVHGVASRLADARGVRRRRSLRSALTGLQAQFQSRALAQSADRTRNEIALLNAQADLTVAYEAMALRVNRLRKLPYLLALDDAHFDDELDALYQAIDDRAAERAHLRVLSDYRRHRAIEAADCELVETQRRTFTAEQGYENQRRLKERNLKTWETRAEALQLDAETKTAEIRGEIDSSDPAAEIRRTIEAALGEARADGNDYNANQWERVLDALADRPTKSE